MNSVLNFNNPLFMWPFIGGPEDPEDCETCGGPEPENVED